MKALSVYSKRTGLQASAYLIERSGDFVTWEDKKAIFLGPRKVVNFLLEKVRSYEHECIIKIPNQQL